MFSIGSSSPGSLSSRASLGQNFKGVLPGALALGTDPYGELLLSTYSGQAASIGYCPVVTTLNCGGRLGAAIGPLLPRSIAVDGRHGRVFALGSVANSSVFTVLP